MADKLAGRIDGRKADQVRGQRNQIVDPVVNRLQESFVHPAI